MDLKVFYNKYIKESEYHYKFFDFINSTVQRYNVLSGYEELESDKFEVFDDEEAITQFKGLCQPEVDFQVENKIWFYLLTYYLHKSGYILKEFPRILARPPVNPGEFTYGEIRNRLISLGEDDNGTVRYATRRKLVSSFEFEKQINHINIDDSLNKKFEEISTRQASLTFKRIIK